MRMTVYEVSKSLNHLPKEELDEIFKQGRVNIGWWNSLGASRAKALSQYADGFYNAARDLLDRFVEVEFHLYSDAEALPVFFLIFHFIELALKASIEAQLRYLKLMGKPVKEWPRNHNIANLLQLLSDLFPPDEEFLSAETIAFIHKMAELNGRSAQAFRYPFEKGKGTGMDKTYWEDRPVLSMGILRAEFAIHGTELNNLQRWLYHGREESYYDDGVDARENEGDYK